MLPDFPELKTQISALVHLRMRRSLYADAAFLAEARHYRIYEGDQSSVRRLDSSIETKRYRATEVKFEIDTDELTTLSPERLVARMDDLAGKMAEKLSKRTFEELREVTARTGNVVEGRGRPLSPELFFEALEKVELDFYEDGSPHEMAMVVGPQQAKALEALIRQWQADPEIDKKYQAVLAKKREEWRVRETCRKLVD